MVCCSFVGSARHGMASNSVHRQSRKALRLISMRSNQSSKKPVLDLLCEAVEGSKKFRQGLARALKRLAEMNLVHVIVGKNTKSVI